MKNYTLLLLILTVLFNCTDSIGSLTFEEKEENLFSIFIPEVGTFYFKQDYSPTTKPNKITTSLKVLSNGSDTDKVNIEVLAFKNDTKKFSNLVFTHRGDISKNQNDYKVLDTNGGFLLNGDQLEIDILITSNDTTNISGHYEGICKLTTINDDNTAGEVVIFNMYGNINSSNNLLLFPTDSLVGIDYISGIYSSNYTISGATYKDNIQIGILSNNATDSIYDSNKKTITDTLTISNTNNVNKRLDLTIQKID